MATPFDRVFPCDTATSSRALRDGCAPVRGGATTATGQGRLFPRKGGTHLGAECGLAVLGRGRSTFDGAAIQDRPRMRGSPHHGRGMRARVAAMALRGGTIWDGATVPARPGTGRFIRRTTH